MRDTSIEAYEHIQKHLSRMCRNAWVSFFYNGPMTGKELAKQLGHDAWKLCSIMKKNGTLIEIGKRPCKVTGRNAYIWELTFKAPIRVERVKTKRKCPLCGGKGEVRVGLKPKEYQEQTQESFDL